MNNFSDQEGKSAIEVLVSGSSLEEEIDEEDYFRNHKHIRRQGLTHEEASNRTHETWIRSVRIQSIAINLLLKWSMGKADWRSWDNDVKIFMRPFRCFVRVQQSMKEKLQALEEYSGSHPTLHRQETSRSNVSTSNEMSTTTIDTPAQELLERPASPGSEEITIAHIATIPGALEQIRCYIEFVDERILPFYREFDRIDESKTYQVRYEDLWYIFRVGEILYAPEKDASQGYTVAAAQTLWRIHKVFIPGDDFLDEQIDDFRVGCYYIDYDGTEFGAVTKTFTLKSYDDERNVTTFPFYPVRFVANSAEFLAQARSTGMNFIKSIQDRYGSYSGWKLMHDPHGEPEEDSQGEPSKTPEHIDSDVIVDFKEAFNHRPTWKPKMTTLSPCPVSMRIHYSDAKYVSWSDMKRTEPLKVEDEDQVKCDGIHDIDSNGYIKEDKYLSKKGQEGHRRPEPQDDDLALLPRRIVGYALWERKFVRLDTRFLHHAAVNAEDNPFDKLQINAIHKKLIQSVVTAHFIKKGIEKNGTVLSTQDLIRGKGKGVVILLHGVPGVGKTATAEAVAQKWGKPLFPITCGDLGFTADSVESSLNEIFRLAHLWDCVLLLDEADVFIEQRTKKDLQRNALVSGNHVTEPITLSHSLTRISIPPHVGVLQWDTLPHDQQTWCS